MLKRLNSIGRVAIVSSAIAVFLATAMNFAGPRSLAYDTCPVGCSQQTCGDGISPLYPDSRSFDDFVVQAYSGVGRIATCSQRQTEYSLLVNAAANNALSAEAQRFVSTLFETQGSYDVQDLCTYTQTSSYEGRNSVSNTDRASIESFVADLYRAFLQRAPDSGGQCFWANDVCSEGRKKGIIAFAASIEFGRLVDGLFDGGPVCCPHHCPSGYFWDCDFGYCVPE